MKANQIPKITWTCSVCKLKKKNVAVKRDFYYFTETTNVLLQKLEQNN